MKKQQGFTIIELLVSIAIIAVLVGLLFPAIGAVKRSANQKANDLKVRNIIQGMISHSESHRGFFPGFNGFEFEQDTLDTTGNSGVGQTVQARYWILLNDSYLVGDSLVSGSESKDPWTGNDVTVENYSYAMLKLADSTNTDPFAGNNGTDAFRREEWRNEQNPLAPIVSDRLVRDGPLTPDIGVTDSYLSIHDGSEVGDWRGSIGFGDLSVQFSSTTKIPTRIAGYNNVDRNATAANEDDDIFDASDSFAATAADIHKHAAMTYDGHNTPEGVIP